MWGKEALADLTLFTELLVCTRALPHKVPSALSGFLSKFAVV